VSAGTPTVWVDNDDELARAVERLRGAAAIAVDTEADSFYHYLHKCCLIQVSDGDVCWLIDPLALKGIEPLGEVLSAQKGVKVLHAAEQDVMYLRRDFGFNLKPVFDTMIAAQLLGKPGVGLASLLEAHFGISLDKGSQRDDWSRRPLTDRQKAYAAEDVRHLIRLAGLLEEELRALGRLEWAREEFDLVARRAWEPRVFDRDNFWGVKGSRDLMPREAAILRELFARREERALQADVPPFRIMSDETLLALAHRAPRGPEDLEGIKGVTPLVRRRLGDDILAAVHRGRALPEAELPTPPRGQGRRRTGTAQARLDRLREWRRGKATALGLDPGVLFPQSTLEALANAGRNGLDAPDGIPGLRDWRRRLLAPDAAALLA
jgi:ribonuclease D